MWHSGRILVCVAAGIATGSVAYGLAPDSPGHPFQSIVLANVFRLQAPPIAVTQPVTVRAPLPPVRLTGISDGFGKTQAFLEVMLPAAPPNQPKTTFLTLGPGEQQGEIQVLRISIKAGVVEAKLFGIVTNLNLNANSPKATAAMPMHLSSLVPPRPLTPPSQPDLQLNRDEAALVLEAERGRLRRAGDPAANLMPPTHLTPPGAPGAEISSPDTPLQRP